MFRIIGIFALVVLSLSNVACQNKRNIETVSGLKRVHFDFDRATLTPNMIRVMDDNAAFLKARKKMNIVIEGHCDERGTNEYNIALGERRAQTAKDYLEAKGISSGRLKTMSYGEEKPLETGSSESDWYMNRRAEFLKH